MKTLTLTMIALTGLLLCTSLPARAALSASGKQAEETLRRATMFRDAKVGYAGTTPPEVQAFRRLLREKEAASTFKRLLKQATLAGQLYALCGLRIKDRALFKRVVERYARDHRVVKTQRGCIISGTRVSRIVKRKGAVRLADGQSMQDWIDKNKHYGKKGCQIDIYGGWFSESFKPSPAAR